MLHIALTGGFGSGKTTVLKLFKRLGALTVDVDSIVHEILKRREIIRDITALLGEDVVRGHSLNKEIMAKKIFDDVAKRRRVEAIIHPLVLKEIKRIKSVSEKDSSVLIFEIPLLYEASFERYFDKNIVVYCDRKTAIKRLIKKGFSEADAMKRIKAQLPIERKAMLADYIIDNSNGIKKTETQVREVFKKLILTSLQTPSP